LARVRAAALRWNPSSSIAASTRERVASVTRSGWFSTWETVPRDTPARCATWAIEGRPVVRRLRGGVWLIRPPTAGASAASPAEGAGPQRLGGELRVVGVGDVLEGQPLRRAQRRRADPVAAARLAGRGGQHTRGPVLAAPPLPHLDQRPHQGADHVVAEGIGLDGRDDEPGIGPPRAGPRPAEL